MNLIKKILIAAGCAVALSACKKDNPQPGDYISFKLNGIYKIIKPDAYNDYDGTFFLAAGGDLKNEISLYIDTVPEQRTYHFENVNDRAAAGYDDDSGTDFLADTGTMTINYFDGDRISGTFSFKGRTFSGNPATINISEGHFDATLSYPPYFPPDSCAWSDSTYSVRQRRMMIKAQSFKSNSIQRHRSGVPFLHTGQ
ncbi:MAG: hypothetical protein JST32_04270 [Bacteroidetes bacterium]|nr:hypothetical protein [Bacteroidota bacterium]